jgi:1-deoxy-D-xylulose-5-phosphate synthase
MRFVKPLDTAVIEELARTHELVVTVEEHQVLGGAGSAVCEVLKGRTKVLLLGLPDRFIDHGDPGRLLASVGLDAEGIRKSITAVMSE